jgi:hypothetical protein
MGANGNVGHKGRADKGPDGRSVVGGKGAADVIKANRAGHFNRDAKLLWFGGLDM